MEYEKEISRLRNWTRLTNNYLTMGTVPSVTNEDCQRIKNALQIISTNIQGEYPYYSQELLRIGKILFNFSQFPYGRIMLNVAAFGELFIIVNHISSEPINTQFWQNIHPRITKVSKDLFCDGHFAAASEAAIKEIETRMRELFKEGKPNSTPPKNAAGLIGALLSDTGSYQFCDTTEISGANFRKGIRLIFDGFFTAYRNTAMHANLPCTQKEAFERIVQASQLMHILTDGKTRVPSDN